MEQPKIDEKLMQQMILSIIYETDKNLSGFPDSFEKKLLLEEFKNYNKKTEMTNQQVLELKSKLKTDDELEKTKIILEVLDNYKITSEVKLIFSEHTDLIKKIKDLNKSSGNDLRLK